MNAANDLDGAGAAVVPNALSAPAPAKLNLFLHVTARRPDGYHELETVFDLIDLADTVTVRLRDDGRMVRTTHADWPAETDLAVRAALGLREAAGLDPATHGVEIAIDKRIPAGGGLGGGSSDAATVLRLLDRLWGLHWPLERLAQLGLALGADVPVFVMGRPAYARGVGEQLEPLALPPRRYVVVAPPAHVPTAQVFGAPGLTRNSALITVTGFSRDCNVHPGRLPGRNDLEPVVIAAHPAVAKALSALRDAATAEGLDPGAVRMTGSGACVFVAIDAREGSMATATSRRIAERMISVSAGTVHECIGLDSNRTFD